MPRYIHVACSAQIKGVTCDSYLAKAYYRALITYAAGHIKYRLNDRPARNATELRISLIISPGGIAPYLRVVNRVK